MTDSTARAEAQLRYIADSPSREHGGFHEQAIAAAKDGIAELQRLQAEVERLTREMKEAWQEAYCCDDVKLDQPLAGFISELQHLREAAEAKLSGEKPSRQDVVTQWAIRCFGADHVYDPRVRAVRLVEEAIEFAQSVDADPAQLQALVDYIYNRAPGKPAQELGGVGVTWLAAASAAGVNAEVCLDEEIARVLAKPESHFTSRNQNKIAHGFTGLPSPPTEGKDNERGM